MKAILKIRLFVVMLLALFPTTLYAQTQFRSNELVFSIISEEHKEVVLSSASDASGDLIIPSVVSYNEENYSVVKLAERCCWLNDEITSVVIPNTVKEIGSEAFYGCEKIITITLPNRIRLIGDYAFAYCFGLESVNISDNIDETFNEDGEVGVFAFRECSSLTSVTLPTNITKIGSQSFCSCRNLKSIKFPERLTDIKESAFSSCGLTSVVLPESLTYIGNRAFEYCDLVEIKIPKSVTYIDVDAFYGNYDLNTVTIDEGNSVYDSRDNCNAIIETATDKLLRACRNTIIPASVKIIGRDAFFYMDSITITIPSTLQSLEINAIVYCRDLNVVVEDGKDVLSGLSFPRCKINNFHLGRNIESSIPIRGATYEERDQAYIKNLTIGKSVSSIPHNYFGDCSEMLETISVDKENSVYSSPDNCNALISNHNKSLLLSCKNTFIPNGVEIIGDSAFVHSPIQNITIPQSVRVIGDRAFQAAHLQNISIPKTVESLGFWAFVGCYYLEKVVLYGIPDTNESFAHCEQLREVRSYSKTPKECSFVDSDWSVDGQGSDSKLFSGHLFIPKGTKEIYASLAEWNRFDNVYEFDTSGVDDIDVDESNEVVEVARYDITGKLLTQPQKGVNIVKMSDGSIKKVIVK